MNGALGTAKIFALVLLRSVEYDRPWRRPDYILLGKRIPRPNAGWFITKQNVRWHLTTWISRVVFGLLTAHNIGVDKHRKIIAAEVFNDSNLVAQCETLSTIPLWRHRKLPNAFRIPTSSFLWRLPIISSPANARISGLLCEDKMSLGLISLLLRLTLLCLNAGSRQEKTQVVSDKRELY